MIIKLFSALFLLCVFGTTAFSSHLMGGEITWECQSNGSFKFTMKVYRDCNGISFSGIGITLTTTHPIGSIPMILAANSPVDISTQGPGCSPCGSPDANPGKIHQVILESGDVILNGIPPTQGWVFYWGECCRNAALNDQIQNANGQGFVLRAIMYPYNGQNTNPCFDSSPYFAEKPDMLLCTRYSANYIHQVVDNDLDSLVYDWGEPMNSWTSPAVTYVFPFSYNSPLPQPYHNPNNEAAVMNPMTGEVTFTSYTQGYFIVLTKITSYRCGIKISEIYREIAIILIECVYDSGPPVLYNSDPDINAPFEDPVTGMYTRYTDTVNAGSTVNFFINATDFELTPLGTPQTVTLSATGAQFGAGFTDASSGCLIPPCATLAPPPPVSAMFGVGTTFNWLTDCSHLQYDTLCSPGPKAYTFVIKAKDDFCPANAMENAVITIVVNPAPPCGTVGVLMLSDPIQNLSVYPLSTHEAEVSFSLSKFSNIEIILHDLQGRSLKRYKSRGIHGSNSVRVSTTGLAAGIYFVQINTVKGSAVKKFVKAE